MKCSPLGLYDYNHPSNHFLYRGLWKRLEWVVQRCCSEQISDSRGFVGNYLRPVVHGSADAVTYPSLLNSETRHCLFQHLTGLLFLGIHPPQSSRRHALVTRIDSFASTSSSTSDVIQQRNATNAISRKGCVCNVNG